VAEDPNLSLSGSIYEWPLGVGVEVTIRAPDETVVGVVRLLCAADSPEFERVTSYNDAARVEAALNQVRAGTLVNEVLEYQRKLRELGQAVISPLYAALRP
jgi:hypothetical protein